MASIVIPGSEIANFLRGLSNGTVSPINATSDADSDIAGLASAVSGLGATAENLSNRLLTAEAFLANLQPGSLMLVDGAPDNAVGSDGQTAINLLTGDVYQRQTGVYIKVAVSSFRKFAVPPGEDPVDIPDPVIVPSVDGFYVPSDGPIIVDTAGNSWELGAASGSDYFIKLNNAALSVAGIAILFFEGAIYRKTNAGDWFIYVGPGQGAAGNGWTQVLADPRPVSEETRDPTIPVAILPDGHAVYRFSAAHMDDEYTIATFDNTNAGGHDVLKLGEVLAAHGKTASDIVITPGSDPDPDAVLTITGTTFKINFTAITGTGSTQIPVIYQSALIQTTLDDQATLTGAFNHDPTGVGAGATDTAVICFPTAWRASGTVADFTSLTWNGVALDRETACNVLATLNGSRARLTMFHKVAPAAGNNSFILTMDNSGGKGSSSIEMMCHFVKYVDQSTPVGAKGTLNAATAAPSISLTTTYDQSLVVMGQQQAGPNTNPVNVVAPVVEVFDNDIGAYNDTGAQGVWSGYKPAPTAGTNVINNTLSASDGVIACAAEIKGVDTSDVFDIGPYGSTNVANGGPDISTDVTPIDWPVAEGTGIDGGGDPIVLPSPADWESAMLVKHGINSDRSRAWTDDELDRFAVNCVSMRLWLPDRKDANYPSAYPAMSTETAFIDLVDRVLARGMKVIVHVFRVGGVNAVPASGNTATVTRMGAYLANIAAFIDSRWGTDNVILQPFGEPLSSLGMVNYKAVAQAWLTQIRAASTDIWVLFNGNGLEGTNGWEEYYKSWTKTTPLTDPRVAGPRVIYGHHHYNPMDFTHQGTSSQWPAYSKNYQSTGGSYGIAQIRAALTEFRAWSVLHSVPIIVDELGASRFAPSLAQRIQYVSDIFTVCRELAIPALLWSDDTHTDAQAGNSWFSIMEGTALNHSLRPEWAAVVGSPGV